MQRIQSVDSIRLLAIVSVIAIHTSPFNGLGLNNQMYFHLDVFINQFSRFAVPFFFAISGYFWGVKVRRDKNFLAITNKMGLRIFSIYIAWSIIYLLPYNFASVFELGWLGPLKFTYWNIYPLIENPSLIFLQGTKIHLWFLPALFFSMYICLFFIFFKAEKTLLVVSVSLYLTGLLAKAYSDSLIGFEVDFNTRNGPFFSTLLFFFGYILSKFNPCIRWFYQGLSLFIFGVILHFFEVYTLNYLFGTSIRQDYVVGTFFMGFGAAVLSLSNHPLLRANLLSNLGKYVLGIYAIHCIFVDLAKPIGQFTDSIIWEICYILLVLILSVISVFLISRSELMKRFIS